MVEIMRAASAGGGGKAKMRGQDKWEGCGSGGAGGMRASAGMRANVRYPGLELSLVPLTPEC